MLAEGLRTPAFGSARSISLAARRGGTLPAILACDPVGQVSSGDSFSHLLSG